MEEAARLAEKLRQEQEEQEKQAEKTKAERKQINEGGGQQTVSDSKKTQPAQNPDTTTIK